MALKLRYYGDPVLRKKAEEIKEITQEIRDLAHGMIDVMLKARGCGLAGNQVGQLLRIFVSNMEREDEEGRVHYGEPRVYINPVISNPSEVMCEVSEGCLSIPKLHLPVVRPLTVEVEALDLDGKVFKQQCYGYLARNMMHENDHLNGVLFIDRIRGKKRNEIESYLRHIKDTYYKGD